MTTLKDTLGQQTVDTLKTLLSFVPGSLRGGRKELLVAALLQELTGPRLRLAWELLDRCQRLAVAEAAYDDEGDYDARQFGAKYGERPAFHETRIDKYGRRSEGRSTALQLFLYEVDRRCMIPADLRAELTSFVPAPAPNALATVDDLPASCNGVPLTMRRTESDAMLELIVMLRTVDQGLIVVSDKTALPGKSALQLLTGKLADGDFYEADPAGKDKWSQQIGPIKALAWPLLVQAAGLAQRNGSKLGLTPAGMKAMNAMPADSLRGIWQKWMTSSLIDEFSRIDDIKGQRSQGRVMTAAAPRRAIIGQALRQCPIGAWVSTDELSRFMQAESAHFEVCHDPWKLYIGEPKYGSLGYSGGAGWNLIQFRYLLCLLFEYCATLGMIDVAFVDPEQARDDFRQQWGTDEMEFLSRYDGLMYFRLTALGAYCLGISPDYVPAARVSSARLALRSSLQIELLGGELAPDEVLLLENWALREGNRRWRLDREKAIAAIERGHDAAQLESFLQACDSQPLPAAVESFIRTCGKQGRALKILATSVLIECTDAGIADLIAAHKETAALCMRAGARHLVVRSIHESKFRSMIRVLGFGMAV